jgi:hypothetical protein
MPHDPLCHAGSPRFCPPGRRTETRGLLTPADVSHESIAVLTQSGTGHCPNLAGLAYHINDGTVVLPPLKVRNIQLCRFSPAQPASQEDSEQRSISLALERIRIRCLPKRLCLGRR